MAIKWPLANGVWSNAANWNDGTLPDVGDDVHADGKTVTIDQDIQVLSIRTTQRSGGINGGTFQPLSTLKLYNIVADIYSGGAQVLNVNQPNNIINIIGNIFTGSVNNIRAILLPQPDNIINITGNLFAGNAFAANALLFSASNIVNITGNILANGASCIDINNTVSTLNITGQVAGGTTTNVYGIVINNGYLYVTGLVIGGNVGPANPSYGVLIGNNAIEVIIDEANNSSAVWGVGGSGINTVIKRAKSINYGSTSAAAVNGTNSALPITVNNIDFGDAGLVPVGGFIRLGNGIDSTVRMRRTNGTYVTLVDATNLPNELPTEQDVRLGTDYNNGNKTGTLAMPSPADVRRSIPVDNTVGTADLSAEGFLTEIQNSSNPIAIRLRNVATVETVGDQLEAVHN
jgi:hypothetical protein